MTNKEAINALRLEGGLEISGNARRLAEFMEGLDVAISALRCVEWEDTLWHDAKTDPPKTSGLYYGKKDDTNSMYALTLPMPKGMGSVKTLQITTKARAGIAAMRKQETPTLK